MKKYLKTTEEVVDALKEGKTVYSSCGKYIMIDGILVLKCGNFRTINAAISLEERPYIEESEPFKIEVGKFYKRRDGKKARCFYVNEREAYFTIDGEWQLFATHLAGNQLSNKEPSEYDIIGPWEE